MASGVQCIDGTTSSTKSYSNSHCTINELPLELLAIIMALDLSEWHATLDVALHQYLANPTSYWFGQHLTTPFGKRICDLSIVCSTWKNAVLCTGHPWACIEVDFNQLTGRTADIAHDQWAGLFLKLCEKLYAAERLRIVLPQLDDVPNDFPPSQQDKETRMKLLPLVMTAARRFPDMELILPFGSCDITFPDSDSDSEDEPSDSGRVVATSSPYLLAIEALDIPYPNLRSLSLRHDSRELEAWGGWYEVYHVPTISLRIFSGISNLQLLSLQSCTIDLDILDVTHVRTLNLHGHFYPPDMPPLLHATRHELRELNVGFEEFLDDELDYPNFTIPSVLSPHLRTLTYSNANRGNGKGDGRLFDFLTLPSLEHLTFPYPPEPLDIDDASVMPELPPYAVPSSLHRLLIRGSPKIRSCRFEQHIPIDMVFAPPFNTSILELLQIPGNPKNRGTMWFRKWMRVLSPPDFNSESTSTVHIHFPSLRHLVIVDDDPVDPQSHISGEWLQDSQYWQAITPVIASHPTIRTISLDLSYIAHTANQYPDEAQVEFSKWEAMGVKVLFGRYME